MFFVGGSDAAINPTYWSHPTVCPTCGQYGHSSRLDTILWAIWWTFSCGSKDALLQSFCSCIGYTSSPERIQQCTYLTCGHYGHSIGLVGHWTLDRTPFCGRFGGRHSMADNISLPLSSCFSCIPTIVETLLPDKCFHSFHIQLIPLYFNWTGL